jgi:hypothetical protein
MAILWKRAELSGKVLALLIADSSTGSYRTKAGAVSKTAYIAVKGYTFESTDTHRDGICCH